MRKSVSRGDLDPYLSVRSVLLLDDVPDTDQPILERSARDRKPRYEEGPRRLRSLLRTYEMTSAGVRTRPSRTGARWEVVPVAVEVGGGGFGVMVTW